MQMVVEKRSVSELLPAEYNPRKALKPGDPEYEKLKRSIQQFGYVEPVIWNKRTGKVVGGHQRLTVLKDLGYTEIECVIVDMEPTQEKALNVALNKISGAWDMPKLQDLFKDAVAAKVKEDKFDVDAELKKPTFSKPGDLWLLGKHRLVCGDSTKAEVYETLMAGNKANLIVTDPPYNVEYVGKTKDKLTIQNDRMEKGNFYQFLLAAYQRMESALADDGSIYVFHADTEGLNFRKAFEDAGFYLSGCCIWKKPSMVLGRSPYQWQHEPCLYGWKKKGKHQWYSDRKQTTIWEFDRPSRSREHPTMKPIPLLAYPIQNSSMTNCIVLDPFGGSGSTLIACEQTGRICYTVELDPKYCDVIVNRYIEAVGQSGGVSVIRDGLTYQYGEVNGERG